MSFGRILPKIFAPITTILLANIFIPSEYGIVGICTAFIGFINLLQGLGIDDYIIKEKNLTREKINTAFWSNLSVSVVCFILLTLAAPFIAHLYKEEQLKRFLPVLSINLVLNAIGFVPWAMLRKKLEFKKLFFINFAPLIISLGITLPLGYMKYGAWAIVAGSVTLTLLTNLYFVLQSKWLPAFIFSKAEIYKMLDFGKYVVSERIQEYLYANIDIFLIGFFLDLRTLGIYTLAKSWSWLIFGMVTSPMTEILYPAFQQFSDDAKNMGKQFLEVFRRMLFITIPIVLLVCGFATKTIFILFPNRWTDAGLILAFLIVGDGISKNFSLQRDLFKLLGKPDIYPKAFLVNFFYTILVYPIAAKVGLITFLFIKVGNDILYTALQYYLTKKIFTFSGKEFYSVVHTALLSGVVTMVMIVAINTLFYFNLIHLSIISLGFSLVCSSALFMTVYNSLDKKNFQKILGEGKVILGIK